MFKVIIRDRLTKEITNKGTFLTEEIVLDWLKSHKQKGKKGNAFGRYYCERSFPKKGLGYDGEFNYNDALIKKEFIKEFDNKDPEQWIKLYAEYTCEVVDITEEEYARELAKKADRKERRTVKGFLGEINNSDLPDWHRRILKVLVKDLRD